METNLTPGLVQALAIVRDKVCTLPKPAVAEVVTKTGGKFTYRYCPLDKVLEYIRDILKAANLVVVQGAAEKHGLAGIETAILHTDGTEVGCAVSFAPFPPMEEGGRMSPIQKRGCEITYLRRYALCAMLGLAADEDTDGYSTRKTDDERSAKLAELRARLKAKGKEEPANLEDADRDTLNRLWNETA